MPDVPDPSVAQFPIKRGILQGDLNCAGHTLLNLDLSGLGLTKASVGLGNVDNTSDLNKPISIATQAALDLKEDLLPESDAGQFLGDGKTWTTYGAFIFENPATNFEFISVKGANASTSSSLRAGRNDNPAIHTRITQFGASVLGNTGGIPAANVGQLAFIGASYGMILTDGAPLIFAPNNIRRMRLAQGLNVGGDTDPGAGCITAFGTITAGSFVGPLGVATATSLAIIGVGGLGFITFAAQVSNPATSAAHIFADTAGKVAIGHSGSAIHAIKFDNAALTADRIYGFLNATGALPVIVGSIPGASGDAGVAGSIAFNASFLFICTASGAWRRVALASF